jgi:serine/threonine protein kinase
MAEVFKACYYRENSQPAFAAIKRILPHLAQDPSFVEMFLSEAMTAGRLQHPSIAQIIEQGEEEGEYFISMEYISGRDLLYLRHHLRERGALMSPALCAHVIASVADALDYAHALCDEQGRHLEIIHRDISPQNILISYEGEVKLIDFGIAKAKDRSYEATRAGVLKGKFSYMAPEQVKGLNVDHRLDIFSLGVVLYELLTNQRLFFGESDLETIELVRNAHVTPPSALNDCISPELDRITMRALAANPDERYQRAGELARELRGFIQQNAPVTSQATLKAWMYQEFATYIAHEQAQEAHIIEQLTHQEEDAGEEFTTETSADMVQELLLQEARNAPAHAEDPTAPPQPAAPAHMLNETSQQPTASPFQTQALMAIAVAPYQNTDQPTRPVSADVFKDLQRKGYAPLDEHLPEDMGLIDDSTEPPQPSPLNTPLDDDEIEELLEESIEQLDMSDLLEPEPTPTDVSIDLATSPQAQQPYASPNPAHTLPLFSNQDLNQNLNQDPETLHEFEAPSRPLSSTPSAPAPQPPAQPAPQLNTSPQIYDQLERKRAEERERSLEVTGPGEQLTGFEDLRPRFNKGKLAQRLLIGVAALTLIAGLALTLPKLLATSVEMRVDVRPRDALKVTLTGSAVHSDPLTKSPLRFTINAPTDLLIEREGYEPFQQRLDPDDPSLKRNLRLKLSPLYPPTELTIMASPGCSVWVNGERLKARTPISNHQITPNELGEVRVKVQHPRLGTQEQVKRVERGAKSSRLAFFFDFKSR